MLKNRLNRKRLQLWPWNKRDNPNFKSKNARKKKLKILPMTLWRITRLLNVPRMETEMIERLISQLCTSKATLLEISRSNKIKIS